MSRVTEVELPDDLPVKNNIVRVTFANPDMFRGFASLSGRVHSASHLPDRIRELVVLRVIGVLGAEVEWGPHAGMAAKNGISEADLEALRAGRAEHFDGADRAAVAFAGAVDRAEVDDAAWEAARAFYSEIELLDMSVLAAFYGLAARVCLALDIQPDPED